ncbi:zonular occludens toxin domain-containing protein [Lysobacter brunescens]|uniref:Zonular occludens toxin domain-containing protein n=1 Tax=Lysobacter brunescens TaxID=262323 RepID=A0ABW2YH25_9GAMM
MIGDTAPLSILTGLPGSGKSLRMVQRIADLVEAGEHVFVCNINGISVPGVTPWDDPSKWTELPAGAILFIDEAQQFFPARRSGEPAAHIRELSKVRHYGIRIVFATQQPDFLDTYIRGLIGFHEHLYRSAGKDETFIFRNHQIMENVRLPFKRIKSMYDYEKWALPSKYFAFYTSAELHKIRYRMPSILKRALIIGPISLCLFGGALAFVATYNPLGDELAAEGADAGSVPRGASADSSSLPGNDRGKQMSTEEYLLQFVPRVPSQPWSAPFYDDIARASAPPRVFCMISGGHYDGTCSCLTEQGTRYALGIDQCRAVALNGQYEPYLEPSNEPPQSTAKREEVGTASRRDEKQPLRPASGRATPFGEMHKYGALELAPGTKY